MQRRTVGIIVAVGVLLLTFVCVGGLVLVALSGGAGVSSSPGDHIAIVPIRGAIVSYGSGGVFESGNASADRLVDVLDDLAERDSVKGVVLQIDSPGGGVTASHEIYLAVERVRAEGKPVVAWYGSTAASGGYYISASADRIIALPGTITGSIGVISQIPNLEGLYEKLGIHFETVKSGEFKDMLSPNRPPTEEEIALLETLTMEMYDDFVNIVATGRDMPEERVRELADGRIYTGRQALELGLIDDLGDFPFAVSTAGELAGLGSDPTTRQYGGPSGFFEALAGFMAGKLGFELLPGLDSSDFYVRFEY